MHQKEKEGAESAQGVKKAAKTKTYPRIKMYQVVDNRPSGFDTNKKAPYLLAEYIYNILRSNHSHSKIKLMEIYWAKSIANTSYIYQGKPRHQSQPT